MRVSRCGNLSITTRTSAFQWLRSMVNSLLIFEYQHLSEATEFFCVDYILQRSLVVSFTDGFERFAADSSDVESLTDCWSE